MSYDIRRGADRVSLDIVGRRPVLAVSLGGTVHTVEEASHSNDAFEIRVDGRTFVFQRLDGVRQADASADAGDEVRAAMPGTVVACHVEEGAEVGFGERLVTIESMKLQMTITAPRAGIVAKVHVAGNVTFERGAVLVSLMPPVPSGEE